MQCPICASEIDTQAIVCKSCGATRVIERTPLGIFIGWAGMTLAVLWSLLWAALFILPFTEHGLSGYPWLTLIIGTVLAIGMLRYSKSTIHSKWVPKEGWDR